MARKKTYQKAPLVPEGSRERYEAILRVLSGEWSMSEAAQRLSISRNHFQSLMHRGMQGLLDGISKKPPGRPARPSQQLAIEQEKQKLLRQNQRLQSRVETIDRLLTVAGDLLKGRLPGSQRSKKTKSQSSEEADEEQERLEGAREMIRLGLRKVLAAAAVGVSPATLRRWTHRETLGLPLRHRRGPGHRLSPDEERRTAIEKLVRRLHGLSGAASLSRCVPGVSRRQAARIKSDTLMAIERERVASCNHVSPTFPGIVRGFDQFCLATSDGPWFALISADTAIPYRSSALLTRHYDGASVERAIQQDFEVFGPPLVWRADRAAAHDTPQVRQLLQRYGVLRLAGPARYPQYYGSLEHLNREHRAWLATIPRPLRPAVLPDLFGGMLAALNNLWKRPRLQWLTAQQAWNQRPSLDTNRSSLRADIHERAASLQRHLHARGRSADMATRLAIQQALQHRGLLGRPTPGSC